MNRLFRQAATLDLRRRALLAIAASLLGLLFSIAVLSPGISALRSVGQQLETAQALYAAEAGLVEAAEGLRREGKLPEALVGEVPETDCSFRVAPIANNTSADLSLRPDFTIPASSVYLEAVGSGPSGRQMIAGALFSVEPRDFREPDPRTLIKASPASGAHTLGYRSEGEGGNRPLAQASRAASLPFPPGSPSTEPRLPNPSRRQGSFRGVRVEIATTIDQLKAHRDSSCSGVEAVELKLLGRHR